MEEVWRPINGYEGCYEVSNIGRIKSLNRYVNPRSLRLVRCRIMVPWITKGYFCVSLCRYGVIKKRYVHRLMASAFLLNPNNYPCINHKNGVKTDNIIENIEWFTYSYNNQHALDYGLRDRKKSSRPGEKNPNAKLTLNDVLEIRQVLKNRKETQKSISKRYQVSEDTIQRINTNRSWSNVSNRD